MEEATYDFDVIDYDGINMWAVLLVGDLAWGVYHMRVEAELINTLYNAGPITECVNEEDRTLVERLHFRKGGVQIALADL